jgi:hypothetical protein
VSAGAGPHVFAATSHTLPGEQSSEVAHPIAHLPDAHSYGAHGFAFPIESTSDAPSIEQVDCGLGTHAFLVQRYPVAQSASEAHDVAHAWPAQLYGAHGVIVGVTHAPLPSHVGIGCAVDPAHEAAPHGVPTAGNDAHLVTSTPSHEATAHASPPPLHGVRAPCGFPFTGAHVPSCPAPSHASHGPSHALPQQ